jgi:hypothetical protein
MGGKKNVLLKMPEGCAGPTPFQTSIWLDFFVFSTGFQQPRPDVVMGSNPDF